MTKSTELPKLSTKSTDSPVLTKSTEIPKLSVKSADSKSGPADSSKPGKQPAGSASAKASSPSMLPLPQVNKPQNAGIKPPQPKPINALLSKSPEKPTIAPPQVPQPLPKPMPGAQADQKKLPKLGKNALKPEAEQADISKSKDNSVEDVESYGNPMSLDEVSDLLGNDEDILPQFDTKTIPVMPEDLAYAKDSSSVDTILQKLDTHTSPIVPPEATEIPAPANTSSATRLPAEWLKGKPVKPAFETQFSSPQIIPQSYEYTETGVPRGSGRVDLERGENLPDELEDIISGYDDEIRHSNINDGARECTIQLAIARILEHTGYEKLAYVRYLKALEANHFSRTAIHELRRIARAYNKNKDVVTLLQSDLDTDIPAEEQALLLEEAGLITFFTPTIANPSEAINMLYRATSLAPNSPSAHCSLFYLLLFEKRYQECCTVLEKIISLTSDTNIQFNNHIALGDMLSSINPGKTAGLDDYLQASKIEPGALYPFGRALAILIRQGIWQKVYAHCIQYADNSDDKLLHHASLLMAGSVASDLMSDSTSSDLAYEQAIDLLPDDTLALEMLINNQSHKPERWKELDHSLSELEHVTTLPRDRISIALLRSINLDENGKNTERAIEVLETLLNDNINDRLVVDYYQKLLLKAGHVDETMQSIQKMAELYGNIEAANQLADLGCYCYDILKKYEEAELNFRNALALDPNQRTAFDYLEQILRARNDYETVARIYRARLDVVTSARQRASVLYTLATLSELTLNQPDTALIYYGQYREIYPDDIHAVHNIARLAHKIGDWKKVIEMLLIEKDSAGSANERCELLVKIADVCLYKLNKPQYAITFLFQAKKENPLSTVVYLELERTLEKVGSWKELMSVLIDHHSIQTNTEDQLVTLNKMADIYENNLCDNNAAVACYEQMLALDPDNIVAYTRLEHIFKNTGNLPAYQDLALKKANRIQLPRDRAKHLFKIALKTLTVFQNSEQAIAILERAYKYAPDYVPVVFLLTVLYGANTRLPQLADLLRDYTNISKCQSTKSATAHLLAYLHIWLFKHPEDSIHPLELSLALAPKSVSARMMLIDAQHYNQQYGEIASLFTEGAQNMEDQAFAIHDFNLAAFIAHAYPNMPGAYDNEINSLKTVIKLDPDNLIANERLEAMEPCRANLVPFLEKRLKNALPADKTELQLAIVESIYTDDPDKAFAMLCEIVEENTSHLPAIRVATNIARKLDNPTLLCRFLAIQAQNLENVEMRVISWTEAAKIAKDKLSMPDLAIEDYTQAFMLAPQRMDICDELIALFVQKRDIASIENIIQIHLRSISRENQIIRCIQIADCYLNEFNEPGQAAAKLKFALEIDPENVEILWKYAQIRLSLHQWNDAKSAFETLLDLPKTPEDIKHKVKISLATLYIDHLNHPDAATPLLQQVIAVYPNDIQALDRLAVIYFQNSRLDESLKLLLQLNQLLKTPQNVKILLRIASVYNLLKDDDRLTEYLFEIAKIAQHYPETLPDIKTWLDHFSRQDIIKLFVEKLVEDTTLSDDAKINMYEFANYVYSDILDDKPEADKFAVMAAGIAPKSLRTRLLAATVQDPKIATQHAMTAIHLAPLDPDPYHALLNIAKRTNQLDLQARLEQQLVALASPIQVSSDLQAMYASSYPSRNVRIDENMIRLATSMEFNPHVSTLLKLAGHRAQIFALPELRTEPLNSCPPIASIVNDICTNFGITNIDIKLVKDAPYIASPSPDASNTLLLNTTALMPASEAEKRFHIAAALMHYSLGTLLLVSLPPDNIAMLISGLIGLYDSSMTSPDILSRIKSFLPRNIRKSIAEYVSTNGTAVFQFDPVQIQVAAASLDTNIGHLFSADLGATITGMFRRRKPNAPVPSSPQQCLIHYSNMPNISSLFLYNVSQKFTDLRKSVGLVIKK